MLEKVKKSGKSFLSPSDEDSIVSIFDIGQRIKMSGLCLLEKLPCLLNSCYARFDIILGAAVGTANEQHCKDLQQTSQEQI